MRIGGRSDAVRTVVGTVTKYPWPQTQAHKSSTFFAPTQGSLTTSDYVSESTRVATQANRIIANPHSQPQHRPPPHHQPSTPPAGIPSPLSFPLLLFINTPQLDLREIVNQPAVAQPALTPTQVSPVTTLMIWQTVGQGIPAQQVQVFHSQAFEKSPINGSCLSLGLSGEGLSRAL